MDYERLIRQADEIPFEGWDFGVFRGRFIEAQPSWEFSKSLRTHMQHSSSMLDLGTGGGSSSRLWRRCRRGRSRQRRTLPTSLSPDVGLRRSGSESSTSRRAATTPSRSLTGPSTSWSAVTSLTRPPRSGASSSPGGRSSPSRSVAETWRSSTTRTIPHPAFPDSRTTASYRVKSAEDVAGALELFRMNYERRKGRNGLV